MTAITGLSEKNWPSLLLGPISVDLATGLVSVSSTKHLKVKQLVAFSKVGVGSQVFEVKKVISDTTFQVGDPDKPIGSFVNPSIYDTGSAQVFEQQRNTIAGGYVTRAVYEEEPTIALRTILVDWLGNFYDDTNPLPVALSGVSGPSKPNIFNVSAPLASTEYSQALPAATVGFEIRVKGFGKLQFAFNPTESATKYWTIYPGGSYAKDGLNLNGKSVYFQVNQPGTTVEILTWSL